MLKYFKLIDNNRLHLFNKLVTLNSYKLVSWGTKLNKKFLQPLPSGLF